MNLEFEVIFRLFLERDEWSFPYLILHVWYVRVKRFSRVASFSSAFLRLSQHDAAYRDIGDVKFVFNDSYARQVIERSISLHPEDNSWSL